jgi:hypothetical protein
VVIVRTTAEVTEQDRREIGALGGSNVPVLIVSPAGEVLVTETT